MFILQSTIQHNCFSGSFKSSHYESLPHLASLSACCCRQSPRHCRLYRRLLPAVLIRFAGWGELLSRNSACSVYPTIQPGVLSRRCLNVIHLAIQGLGSNVAKGPIDSLRIRHNDDDIITSLGAMQSSKNSLNPPFLNESTWNFCAVGRQSQYILKTYFR